MAALAGQQFPPWPLFEFTVLRFREVETDGNFILLSRDEFESRRARKDAFLENLWHNERLSLMAT
jgi:hypothetical protein